MLLEAANFEPLGVLRTSRAAAAAHGVVEPLGEGRRPVRGGAGGRATRRSCSSSSPARAGPVDVDVHDELPERPRRHARPERADALRRPRDPGRTSRRDACGRSASTSPTTATVTVPTWRARDVTREIDLVEEVARFRLEDVPATLPLAPREGGRLTRDQRLRRRVEDVLVGAGFAEAYTWTLVPTGDGRIPLEEPLQRRARRAPRRPRVLARRVGTPESQRGCRADRALRAGAGLPPRRRGAPGGALARGGDHRRRLLPSQGRRRDAVRTPARCERAEDPHFSQLDVRGLDDGLGVLRGRPRLSSSSACPTSCSTRT